MGNRKKLMHFLRVDPAAAVSALSSPRSFFSSNSNSSSDDDGYSSSFQGSASSSPSRSYSPPKSPWARLPGLGADDASSDDATATGLIASLVKEDGKVYSLAAAGDVLYTGTDSETVRVWRDRRELAGFRTGSGLVKTIVVAADGRIFTGHQDGKVRVWRADGDAGGDPAVVHRRVGSLPPLGDLLISSVNPSSYVRSPRGAERGGRRRAAVWLRHSDAVSSLSLDEGAGLLYSASWDRTFKAWRVSDYRCLESVPAHDDAVNTVAAAGFGGLVLTGSADGTVKVWRREVAAAGDRTRHVLERVLREGGDGAVTAIAACPEARAVYVGSSDGLVTCWRWGLDDVDGSEPPRLAGVLAGHGTGVLCLAVSGRVVVSGSADGTLCVWRRDDDDEHPGRHARLAVLAGHTGPIKCVAVPADDDDCYDADGERRFVVYSGSLDGSVKVWRLSEERALEPPAVEATTAPFMAALWESEAWMPRPRTAQLPSPVQAWAPEMKGVAAA
ncbi:protein JINGUBANG-like [Miscanthus floridulus]|uniref:protein JINGUBANG-like n=1 Tax=Miscanthus floridulus TaxID=154761 RepID=UPI003458C130